MKTILLLAVVLVIITSEVSAQSLHYPQPRKIDHTDTYFGVTVADPYRWMENDTSKEVADWVAEENKVTFGYLEKIPYRNAIKERLTAIWNYPRYSAPFKKGSNYFFFKNNGLQNQNILYVQQSLDAEPEVFLDPNKLSNDGTVALAGWSFSGDGKTFAYGISKSGSDWVELHAMDVATRTVLNDNLRWVKFSDISWYHDGWFYSRYDAPSDTIKALSDKNEFHKVYYHKLGTKQEEDVLVYENREHPQQLFGTATSEDERFLFLYITEIGKRGNALYAKDLSKEGSPFVPILESYDDQFNFIDNFGDRLLIHTQRNAPNGKLLIVDWNNPAESNWKEFLPEKLEILSSVSTGGGKIFTKYTKDVTPRVYVYNIDGAMEHELALPLLGSVSGLGCRFDETSFFFSMTSFTSPATIYKYDIPSNTVTLHRKTEIDFPMDDYITEQVFYSSKDGTRIPMFLVHKKGLPLDGNNPTWLYGYGGFNYSLSPSFSTARLIWLEQGGVLAFANLRGGSEYGEKWHEAGTKLKKQNVFEDFIAAAEYLIAQKYTSPAKLAIEGRSNGGLLVGAVINQRPELFKVALPGVGVMDMLRYHKFTIGWSWIDDYGSSDDSAQFKYLYGYSPLHNIREDIHYPATLAFTADHDDRVVPAHSFKYMATLQEKYRGSNPVLIRIETKAGHGGGKPTAKQIEEWADLYAFTFYNMGVTPKY